MPGNTDMFFRRFSYQLFSVGTQQPQHIRATIGGGVQQQQQFVRTSDQTGQSATITYNPRTQRITANVPGTSVQQPVQLVQVGSVSFFVADLYFD